jgi:pimeloyl-ACP methyl ester carboxylesterase
MSHFAATDGTGLFYRDWGRGRPIVFISSWGLDSRTWSRHMLHFNALGYRCIAPDRRGHGRSDDPGHGYDSLDRLADDLAELLDHLDLRDAVLVAHSMGTGECVRYLARHGSARVARLVFAGAVAPSYLDGSRDPASMDEAATGAVLAAIARDLRQWLEDNADGFFLPATTGVTPAQIRQTIGHFQDVSALALRDCFRAKRADQRAELRAIDVPLLVVHGDRDASEPVQQGRAVAALVPGSRYLEYAGAPHGLYLTHFERFVDDVRAFIGDARGGDAAARGPRGIAA